MKKIFAIFMLSLGFSAYAQSLQLKHDGQLIHNNDTIVAMVSAKGEVNTFVEYANVINDDVFFKVRKEEISVDPNHIITFCVGGQCYSGNQSIELFLTEGGSVTIDNTAEVFHSTLNYSSASGSSLVKYTFFNTDDEGDATSFYVHYVPGTGVNSQEQEVALSAYPIPASTGVNISYKTNGNGQLVIRDLTGRDLYRQDVNAKGKTFVNTSSFAPGIYFYGIEKNGRMICSKKMMIK